MSSDHHHCPNQVRHLCGVLTRYLGDDDCCRHPWSSWQHHSNLSSVQVGDDDDDDDDIDEGDDDDDHDSISGLNLSSI